MSESKAKVIERNRPPRVQISYDVERYGSPTTIQLPFVMGVMAGLAGASETREAQKAVPDRAFVEVDAGRFPKFMEALAPRVKARVKNTLPQAEGQEREEELALDLTFKSMGDFAPDKIAEQVPQLAELLKMRRQLGELLGFMDGRIDAEKRIAQLLNNEPLLQQVAAAAADADAAGGDKES
jgi:type VI secretion system protein ImpB